MVSRWRGPHHKGYRQDVREQKRLAAEERNQQTPPERMRATRRLIDDLRRPPREPLLVYDASSWEPWQRPGFLDELYQWMHAHGIDEMDTYRIEVWQLSQRLFTRVFQYRTRRGVVEWNWTTGEPARRKPFLVAITSMPPALP